MSYRYDSSCDYWESDCMSECQGCGREYDVDQLNADGFCEYCETLPCCEACGEITDQPVAFGEWHARKPVDASRSFDWSGCDITVDDWRDWEFVGSQTVCWCRRCAGHEQLVLA